ncbi:helix-turn-helix domain-containing protein [Burkholderia ambifaria]|uniref:helix-turn-helix domain-containing protein n=1 Tax=Burkholderia ambifaria TaxID=152480 RepID=UPI001B945993|nr:helix-turn-helix transcriptional regulator [Burkholderia ambifaria]MBR8343051.1 helix-turn-helix domain-containing protein [Burkholderia ambifaria]
MKPDVQNMVNRLLAAGMTQKAIADHIGCSQPTISDMAAGKIGKHRPTYQIVRGLQELLAEQTA